MATVSEPITYQHIGVAPISGALGAELSGVSLAGPIDDAVFDEIRNAFHAHSVIFFRDQDITPEQHKAFAARFGPLNVHPYVKSLDGHPEIIPIIKEPDEKVNFGGGWHSDMSFLEAPSLGSALYALETPAYGGDTLWASQYLAYEALSDAMKELLGTLWAVHSAGSQYGTNSEASRNNEKRKSMETAASESAHAETLHPVVRVHPETGRKGLFVNQAFTVKFKGMTRRESRPLLQFLYEHCTREEFTCRFRWTNGALALWDNRCTQHFALNDYHGQRRHMHRVTIDGDRPY